MTGSAFATVNNLPTGYAINYNYQSSNEIVRVLDVPEPGVGALAIIGLFGSRAAGAGSKNVCGKWDHAACHAGAAKDLARLTDNANPSEYL